ncbi:MAG: hypothetical protein WA628_13460 [Terriglobales bacterium]
MPTDYVLDGTAQAVKYEYPFATYESETRITEHVLHYSRSYELRDVRIPLERLGDLKKFFRQVSDDERAYTILKVP